LAVLRDTMVILLPTCFTRVAATIPLVATTGCVTGTGRATIGRHAAAGHSAHATAGHASHATAGHAADEHERGLGTTVSVAAAPDKGAVSRCAATPGTGSAIPATAVSMRTGTNLYMCASLVVVSRGMNSKYTNPAKFDPLRPASSLTLG